MRPLFVYIHFSESDLFGDKKLWNFDGFEVMAGNVALLTDDGYKKTHIEVLFSDGQRYECRLDLAKEQDKNFQQHAEKIIAFPKSQKFLLFPEFIQASYREKSSFLSRIDWEPRNSFDWYADREDKTYRPNWHPV